MLLRAEQPLRAKRRLNAKRGSGVSTALSVRLSLGIFVSSLFLSAVLAYQASRAMIFAFPMAPEAMTTLVHRIQAVRAVGLGVALVLMMFVFFAASRAAREALAFRWLLGVATSVAFLRGAGMIHPLPDHDAMIIAVSAVQLGLEATAILLLYGEDASEWFRRRSACSG